MAHKKRFPPCTECGGQSEDTKSTLTFTANDGEIPCWDVKCGWCGTTYQVGMFALPAHASPSALDDGLRQRRRNDKRRKFGYQHPPSWMSSRGAKRIESDRVEAVIKIQPGRVVAALRKRLGQPSREVSYVGDALEPPVTIELPKMGRPAKYATEEERREARRRANREHMRRKREKVA